MDDEQTRRRVLRGVAGGAVAGAVLGWVSPSASHVPASDIEQIEPTARPPLEETETSYAVYQYATVRGDFRRTLPINVVCPLEEASFDDLITVFTDAGWYHRPAEQVRYAFDRGTGRWTRSHWSGADSVFGVGPRIHVRCWELDGTASLQAHIDTPPTPHHRIHSFSEAAGRVTRLFANAGWAVNPLAPDTLDLGNAEPPDHGGVAVVLHR